MMKSRTPRAAKLRPDHQAKLVPDRRGTMLVPTPMLVARALRQVRRGRLITAAQLRDRLGSQRGAELTCPLTTGIFLNIIAGATEEALAEGHDVTRQGRVADVDRALIQR